MIIFELLTEYKNSGIYPFHMPGHKRNIEFLSFGCESVLLDVTEFEETDNLHAPTGIINTAQKECAKVFGADSSYFLVNGSSCGVIAAICACTRQGGKVIMSRNSHKSAYSAIIYSDAQPIYVYPGFDCHDIACDIKPDLLEEALRENSDVSCVFVTSPTYQGYVSDVKSLADIAHKYGVPLIVDEAHGAHFGFHHAFPSSALSQGADVVVQSLHKTLPAFTQSALLHVKSSLVDNRLIGLNLNMAQSTSPSYILMAGIDKCISFLRNSRPFFEKYIENLLSFREKANKFENLILVEPSNCGAFKYDVSKLVFINRKAVDNTEKLLKSRNIQIEMDWGSHFLLMTSVADTENGFDLALKALCFLDRVADSFPAANYKTPTTVEVHQAIEMKKALYSPCRKVTLKEGVGCISADFLTPYPPGIPLLAPGELISKAVIEAAPEKYRDRIIWVVEDTL